MLRRFGNKIKKKFKTAINAKPNLPGSPEFVRDSILEHGKKITEGSAYYWGNATKNGQNGVKGAFMVHGAKRSGTNGFKAAKDFSRGDPVCGTLCTIATCCEVASMVAVWIPFPGKVCTLSSLKSVSVCCERIRDLCSNEPANPICK